ncbi:MAG TPA: hypothetical protein VN700_05810 [Vicinamibacterales bacterium]|nr:hypothetical protein [Vicinamibacterales bacterium]
MAIIILLSLLVSPFQAQSKPAAPPTLTGKWAMAIEIQGTTATPSLELVQDGEKLKGFYQGRYGKFEVTGTLKGKAIQFGFTMSAEGTEVQMAFAGEVAADFQSMKGSANMAAAGGGEEVAWSAKRAQN